MTVYVTARHGRNKVGNTLTDPGLTWVGIWESIRLAATCRLLQWKPTFLVSPTHRTKQTAKIVRWFFPETWFDAAAFQTHDCLFISHRAGDEVTEEIKLGLSQLIRQQPGDVCVITHHQLADGLLLAHMAKTASEIDLVGAWGKQTPGGGHYYCTRRREVWPLRCSSTIMDLDD